MEIFPEILIIAYPLPIRGQWKTDITDFKSGKEQRNKVWPFSKKRVPLNCKHLKQDEMADLWKFYQLRSGAHEAFWFVAPLADYWYNEYVGRGDDSTTIFDLPSKETEEESVEVFVDGGSTSITFLEGGGQAGADRIQFSAAPSEGAVITADFKGRLRLKARFAVDDLTKELFSLLAFSAQLELQEIPLWQ